MAKTYVVILDGAGDRPNPVLYGMTPLEAASTPGLDRLAVRSQHGMLTVIGEGIWPESDSGTMALLSYDPLVHYTGRGPLEGFGLGLVAPGRNAIAFRVNFASFDVAAGRLDRRTARGLSDGQLQELAGALRSDVTLDDFDVEFSLTAYSRHRGIVVFTGRGAALSGHVTNTDPGFRNEGPFGFPVKDYPPRPLVARPRIPTAEATSGRRSSVPSWSVRPRCSGATRSTSSGSQQVSCQRISFSSVTAETRRRRSRRLVRSTGVR